MQNINIIKTQIAKIIYLQEYEGKVAKNKSGHSVQQTP
jgi:hypothetical protein